MPFELRPYPQPTLRPEGDYLQRAWSRAVYPLAEKMGVSIVLPAVSPQPYTHLAFEGYQFAKELGKGNEYSHRVLAAFFREGQDIGSPSVLSKLAAEIGLNEKDFADALCSRRYREAHQRALQRGREEYDIEAVPAFCIGRQRLTGLQSKERLAAVIDEELKAQQKDGR
jgi:predicted DsbA family dithiol-disulfide isomerase